MVLLSQKKPTFSSKLKCVVNSQNVLNHRKGAILNTFWNLCFILLWTAQGILVEFDRRHDYILPDEWWRIVLFVSSY